MSTSGAFFSLYINLKFLVLYIFISGRFRHLKNNGRIWKFTFCPFCCKMKKSLFRPLQVIDSNNLSAIQEAHIALAILHASCQVHCNPRRKPKVVSTPKSATTIKKNTTIVTETEQSEAASEQSKMTLFFYHF